MRGSLPTLLVCITISFLGQLLGMTMDRVWSGYPQILGMWVVGLVRIFAHTRGFGYPLHCGFGAGSTFHPRISVGAPKN
jgi:hypothetical protein